MIPKNIFFIWFGNTVPNYFTKSITVFSSVNSSFNVQFIHRTHDELDKIYHHELKNEYDDAICQIMADIDNVCGFYKESIVHYKNLGRSKKQILSNVFRLDLLNRYGGIYVDGDCFPIKPFDEKLLLNPFVVHHKYANSNMLLPDCFFMGKDRASEKWKSYWSRIKHVKMLIQEEPKNKCIKMFFQKKFINCTLQYGDFFSSCNNYIDHYNLKTWL